MPKAMSLREDETFPQRQKGIAKDEFIENAVSILEEIQANLYNKALSYREENTQMRH